ncbi:hypothetical protein [Nocardia xishanensis]
MFLERLGISPTDLLADLPGQLTPPAFAKIIPMARTAMPDTQTRKTYNAY